MSRRMEKPRPVGNGHLIAVAIAGGLYGVALVLPALVFSRGSALETKPGYECLLMGWMGIFVGQFAWFANVPLVIAALLTLLRKHIAAAILASLAVAIGQLTWMLYLAPLPGDEGGVTKLDFQYPHAGFFVWIASMMSLFVSSIVLKLSPRLPEAPEAARRQAVGVDVAGGGLLDERARLNGEATEGLRAGIGAEAGGASSVAAKVTEVIRRAAGDFRHRRDPLCDVDRHPSVGQRSDLVAERGEDHEIVVRDVDEIEAEGDAGEPDHLVREAGFLDRGDHVVAQNDDPATAVRLARLRHLPDEARAYDHQAAVVQSRGCAAILHPGHGLDSDESIVRRVEPRQRSIERVAEHTVLRSREDRPRFVCPRAEYQARWIDRPRPRGQVVKGDRPRDLVRPEIDDCDVVALGDAGAPPAGHVGLRRRDLEVVRGVCGEPVGDRQLCLHRAAAGVDPGDDRLASVQDHDVAAERR
jgi:hypothetical protein